MSSHQQFALNHHQNRDKVSQYFLILFITMQVRSIGYIPHISIYLVNFRMFCKEMCAQKQEKDMTIFSVDLINLRRFGDYSKELVFEMVAS